MSTLDTTRLRALAEAVRDAGEKSAYAHHVVRRLFDAGHHGITSVRKDARAAADRLRAAQKALYADGPADGIILALLDEVERLRVRLDDYPGLIARAYMLAPHLSAEERHLCQARHEAARRLGIDPSPLKDALVEPEEGGGSHG